MQLLSLLLISILVPVFFVGSLIYLFIFRALSQAPVPPGSAPFDLYPVMMRTNLVISIGFIPLFLLLFFWGVIVTHRITGPTQRLRREIERIAESGDFRARLSVRKNDYMKPLIDAVNKMLDKFCESSPKK